MRPSPPPHPPHLDVTCSNLEEVFADGSEVRAGGRLGVLVNDDGGDAEHRHDGDAAELSQLVKLAVQAEGQDDDRAQGEGEVGLRADEGADRERWGRVGAVDDVREPRWDVLLENHHVGDRASNCVQELGYNYCGAHPHAVCENKVGGV